MFGAETLSFCKAPQSQITDYTNINPVFDATDHKNGKQLCFY